MHGVTEAMGEGETGMGRREEEGRWGLGDREREKLGLERARSREGVGRGRREGWKEGGGQGGGDGSGERKTVRGPRERGDGVAIKGRGRRRARGGGISQMDMTECLGGHSL